MNGADRVALHRARKLAAIPVDVFDAYLSSLPADRSPSEAGAVKFAAAAATGGSVTACNDRRCPHCGGLL